MKILFQKLMHCFLGIIFFASCQSNDQEETKTEKQLTYGKPNIILIVVDDLRWDEFSAAGHPFLKTPNIDRLAKEGTLFENAYQAVPLCSPNRACILTGQYPSRHGIVDNVARDKASHQLKLFAPVLQQAGYETAHIGKWHMGNDPTPRPGYNYWVSFPGQGKIIDPILYENDKTDTVKGYITDLLTDRSIEFIKKKREKPFFLYLGHKAIHPDAKQLNNGALDPSEPSKFIPAERHKDIYKDAKIVRRKNAISSYAQVDSQTVTGEALYRKRSPGMEAEFGKNFFDHFTSDQTIRDRSEMLLSIDDGLGRIIKELEDQNILDKTMIIFTSDNGYFYGEHGLSLERRFPYEESVRTPLLIRYPPIIRSNTKIKDFVVSVDYAPTILMLAEAPIGNHIQGRSILPLLEGNNNNWRRSFLMEYYSFENPFPWLIDTDYKALRTERYKYIHWFKHENKDELYDLVDDPYEINNLVNRKDMQTVVKEMKEKLALEVAKTFGLNN
jgi:N-acetylglucosamine-6-sulfatase